MTTYDPFKWVADSADQRAILKHAHRDLFREITDLLFEIDPIGINYEINGNEYEPEVGTILPRLSSCGNVDDARKIIHEEFVRWFGGECLAGKESEYQEAAEAIWELWTRCDPECPDHSETSAGRQGVRHTRSMYPAWPRRRITPYPSTST